MRGVIGFSAYTPQSMQGGQESHSQPSHACILLRYGTGKKKRLSYLVGNLVATNWPIEKALHAIGYNQIPTK